MNLRFQHSGPKFLVKIEKEVLIAVRDIERDVSLNRFTRAQKKFELSRQVLERLCQESQTFGPILSLIKEEFEFNFKEMCRDLKYKEKERRRALEELKELQANIAEQAELSESAEKRNFENCKPSSALDQLRNRTRLAHSQTRLDRMEREKQQFIAQITQMERREREILERLEDEQEAKDLMFNEYAQLQKAFDQFKDSQKGREDPEILRMALDQSRRDLGVAHAKINEYKYDYDSVVPQVKYDQLDRHLSLANIENDKLSRDISHLKQEKADLLSMIKEMTEELETKRLAEDEEKMSAVMKEGVQKWKKEVAQ